ncbi:MAG: tRNA (adenosine(37)-N6)-dimethylallyltransferase MiaA [Geitlerinemataceae cyanobacterium]
MCTSLPLIVICGATATGKSSLALELAKRWGLPILSADSRQVYREFDIGTAKPTIFDRQLVPHYSIDICDPTETLTVADYQQQVQGLIDKFHQMSISPLLVGGTGLYIKAITRGLKIPRVPPNPELRSQLAELGQPLCYNFLQQIDPVAAQKIHRNDATRTLRALEVFYTTGLPISQQQGENPPNYPIVQIGLECDPQRLDDRIRQRTHQMIEAGLVEEVETLCQKYGTDLPLLATLGYGEIKQYLAGDFSLAKAIDLTVLHTRQFAKRQRTWFRQHPEVQWFDADRSDLFDAVAQWIRSQ